MTSAFLAATVGAFLGTSADDFVLLVALFGMRDSRAIEIAVAKLISTCMLLGCSVILTLLAFGSCGIPSGIAGLTLLAIGVSKATRSGKTHDTSHPHFRAAGCLSCWLPITLSGTDNCIAYIALFAGARASAIELASTMIMTLTVVLCLAASTVARRFRLTRGSRLAVGNFAPWLLILLGIRSTIAPWI